jgi:hypothetical protein
VVDSATIARPCRAVFDAMGLRFDEPGAGLHEALASTAESVVALRDVEQVERR